MPADIEHGSAPGVSRGIVDGAACHAAFGVLKLLQGLLCPQASKACGGFYLHAVGGDLYSVGFVRGTVVAATDGIGHLGIEFHFHRGVFHAATCCLYMLRQGKELLAESVESTEGREKG